MNITTRRFPRSLAEAFPDERAPSIYLDMSLRAIVWRWLRRIVGA